MTVKSPLPPDPQRIALAGDWHGSPISIEQIGRAHEAEADVVIHLGDFGYWRDSPATSKYLSRIERLLTLIDLTLFWVDGNHEDHARLDRLPIDPVTGLRKITNHIWHLPRGLRWTWGDYTWMALGGAHSVDRAARVAGKDWWPQEYLSDDDLRHAKRPGQVDVMVTHDAPDTVDIPAIRGPSGWPEWDLVCSANHRQLLGDVLRAVRPVALWHGHYHCRYADDLILDDGTRVHVEGLADDDAHWRDNIVLVGPSGQLLPWPAGRPVER